MCFIGKTEWVYAVATVTVQTDTTSNVCIVAANCQVCGTVNGHYIDPGATLEICTGLNGYEGMIKSMHFFDIPFTNHEASLTYATAGCAPYNGAACPYCPRTTMQCFSNCAIGEYGPLCEPCDSMCSSCFGGSNF